MTLDEIEARLHEAITTLAALPDRERAWLKGGTTSWPPVLRDMGDVLALFYERKAQGKAGFDAMTAPRPVADPCVIDRMDATMAWLRGMERRDTTIIVLRAHGMSFERIAWRLKGKSE